MTEMKIEITKTVDGYAATVAYPWGQKVRCCGGTVEEAVKMATFDIAGKERAVSFAGYLTVPPADKCPA